MDDTMITVSILAMIIVITLLMLVANFNKVNKLNAKLNYTERELIKIKDEINQLKMSIKSWNWNNMIYGGK